jgi:hypothetical protein
MSLENASRAIWSQNVIRRSVEQQTVGAVEALRSLFERHRPPDEPILQRAIAMIADRILCQCVDQRRRSVEEHGGGHSDREDETCSEREPSAGEFPRTMFVNGRLAKLITQAVRELPGWLQFRRAIEGGSQSATHPTTSVNLGPARWTGIEMPEDLVIRFRQQLLTEKRIGDFANVATIHDASTLLGEAPPSRFDRPPAKATSAAASSARSWARPR